MDIAARFRQNEYQHANVVTLNPTETPWKEPA
jgi:hypothetical protein